MEKGYNTYEQLPLFDYDVVVLGSMRRYFQIPIVTEIPRALHRITRDTFIDDLQPKAVVIQFPEQPTIDKKAA